MLSKPEKLGKLSNCPKSGNPAKTSSKDVGWRRMTGSGVSSPDCDVMRESGGGGGYLAVGGERPGLERGGGGERDGAAAWFWGSGLTEKSDWSLSLSRPRTQAGLAATSEYF